MYNAQVSSKICQELETHFTEARQTANNDACPTRAFAQLVQNLNKKRETNKWVPQGDQNQKKQHYTNFRPRVSDWRSNGHASTCSLSHSEREIDCNTPVESPTMFLLPFKYRFLLRSTLRSGIGCVRMIPSQSVFRNTAVTFILCSDFMILVLN